MPNVQTPENAKPLQEAHIRWMIRRDMPEVLKIEADGFEPPWHEADFVGCLRKGNHVGMVAEVEDRVAGFMIYALYEHHIQLLNFAVAAERRHRRVGSQMIAKFMAEPSAQQRRRIVLQLSETNLAAQLFFHEHGFRAVSVLRDAYEDGPTDAYVMEYRYVG